MKSQYLLIEVYKGRCIWEEQETKAIGVNNLGNGTDNLFFPALDDSKTHGPRQWIEKYNTQETARAYIDQLKPTIFPEGKEPLTTY